MLYFDRKEIEEMTGLHFDNDHDVIMYLVRRLEFLTSHNVNYTREQARALDDIENIVNNLEVDHGEYLPF